MVTDSGVLDTTVYHKRHTPAVHDFSHKVLYLALNLKDIECLKSKLFSINRFNIFSLSWKNYGFELFEDPKTYVKKTLEKFEINPQSIEEIVFLTMPKILGYAFNPVSFWLCFNKTGDLFSVLVEVNNTFGERHAYVCFQKNLEPIKKNTRISKDKIFHVSPFCEVEGYYEFRFNIESQKIDIDINYYKDDSILISTSIRANKNALIDKYLAKYIIKLPIMLFKVIILIHYHAFRLWIKKVQYFKKPAKPTQDLT